jgi:hypothetical protein
VGGAVLVLTLAAGGIALELSFRAPRAGDAGAVAAPAGNVPFVPPDLRPAPADPAPPPQRPGRFTGNMPRFRDDQILTVVVTGITTGEAGKYVLDQCARQLPPGNASTRSHMSGGVMQIALAPVGDPQAFANKIDFGTVTRIDGRVVYVTARPNLPPPVTFRTPQPARLKHEPPAAADLPGLAGSWSLDEGQGAQAGNAAGNRQPAALHNARWMKGVRGQCLSFNGAGSYLELGPDDNLSFPAHAEFTVAVWVQTTKASGTLLSFRHTEDEGAVLDLAVEGGRAGITLRPDRNIFIPFQLAGGKVDDGAWHHVLVLRQADGRAELYVDGALVQGGASDGGSITTNWHTLGRERFWVEKKPGPGDAHFEGCLDELCVFKRALKPEEIRKLAGQE